jgi:hypothetical protein
MAELATAMTEETIDGMDSLDLYNALSGGDIPQSLRVHALQTFLPKHAAFYQDEIQRQIAKDPWGGRPGLPDIAGYQQRLSDLQGALTSTEAMARFCDNEAKMHLGLLDAFKGPQNKALADLAGVKAENWKQLASSVREPSSSAA